MSCPALAQRVPSVPPTLPEPMIPIVMTVSFPWLRRASAGLSSGLMDFLEAPDANGVAFAGHNRLGSGFGATQRRDARNPVSHRGAADVALIFETVAARGCINDQLQSARLHQIDGV